MDQHVGIASIMTRDVVTVSENDRLHEIAERLSERNISGAPVVSGDGKVVGMISDGDVLRYLNTFDPKTGKPCRLDESKSATVCKEKFGIYSVQPALAKDLFDSFEKASRKTARDVMTSPVITPDIGDDIESVSSLMMAHGIKRVPIIQDGKLAGIVSRADIVKYVANRKKAAEFART
jgi:CBS domain-containing protein